MAPTHDSDTKNYFVLKTSTSGSKISNIWPTFCHVWDMSKTFPTKGQMTDVPTTVTYDGVVSMKTVCIALTMTVLNDLKAMSADIMDTYITSSNKKDMDVTWSQFW